MQVSDAGVSCRCQNKSLNNNIHVLSAAPKGTIKNKRMGSYCIVSIIISAYIVIVML